MVKASQKFDRQLFALKLLEPARKMQLESAGSGRQVPGISGPAQLAAPFLVRIANGQLGILRNWLREIDRTCREVWQTQAETVTPEFIREILAPEALMAIEARAGTTQLTIDSIATRTQENPHNARESFAMEVNRLKAEVSSKYEIEARELEYSQQLPRAKIEFEAQLEQGRRAIEAATRTLETSREEDSRKVHNDAFEKELHEAVMRVLERLPGVSVSTPGPGTWRSWGDEFKQLADEESQVIQATKNERLFADCYFDSSLALERATTLELREGADEYLRARFEALATRAGIATGCAANVSPLKFWLFKLFLYLSETKSRHLYAPTSEGRIAARPQSDFLKTRAGEVPTVLGGLITNVYEASANFCFWLQKQALETEHLFPTEPNRGGTDRSLRTEEEQAEGSPAKNNFKLVQNVEGKSTRVVKTIGPNINTLRKECGWSFDDLARETGIDKKSILSHVNKGTRPVPRILKEYAQAFSKALGRAITAPELEE